MDPLQIVWARYLGAFLLAFVFLNPITQPKMMVTTRPLHASWPLGAVACVYCTEFFALRYLQLDEALAILFSTPFLVALLCGPLLGEWVGWRRWTAISVGFFGVLLVARPGFGGLHPAALLSLGSAVCYALYVISTRVLARSDSSETTLFYSNLVGAVAMFPIVPFVWTTPEQRLRGGADGAYRRAWAAAGTIFLSAAIGWRRHRHLAPLSTRKWFGRRRLAFWCSVMCRIAGPSSGD